LSLEKNAILLRWIINQRYSDQGSYEVCVKLL
jgi:hypothetical protein